MNNPFSSKLAIQHARFTMLLALSLGLLISTSQIIYDAFDEQAQLKQDLKQALNMFESPLKRAILDIDEGLAQSVIQGLFHHPAITSASVIDHHKTTIATQQRAIQPEGWLASLFNFDPIEFEHVIADTDTQEQYGTIQLQASQSVLIDRLLHRAAIVFSSGLIRNTLLALLFLMAFYLTLTLPLINIIKRIAKIDPAIANNAHIEPPAQHRNNEIGELANTINRLLDKFGHTLEQRDQAESALKQHKVQLEDLVQERTQALEQANLELKSSFKKLIQLEHDKGVSEERERIMRDMHDGVGGLLISTLSMVTCDDYSRDDIEQAVRASMTDLRLIIDSLDSTADDLNSCLGMFRNRVAPQLEVQNITFKWDVDQAGDEIHYSSDTRLQLVRILQEFVTNSIKHSQGDCLSLRCDVDQTQVKINISDNGKGFQVEDDYDGRGLSNMTYRAEKIHATASLTSNDKQGTELSLTLPLPA